MGIMLRTIIHKSTHHSTNKKPHEYGALA